jgi:hypothetical protein
MMELRRERERALAKPDGVCRLARGHIIGPRPATPSISLIGIFRVQFSGSSSGNEAVNILPTSMLARKFLSASADAPMAEAARIHGRLPSWSLTGPRAAREFRDLCGRTTCCTIFKLVPGSQLQCDTGLICDLPFGGNADDPRLQRR